MMYMQLIGMFRACTYDTYMNDQGVSPWCILLGEDAMEAIEYRDGILHILAITLYISIV